MFHILCISNILFLYEFIFYICIIYNMRYVCVNIYVHIHTYIFWSGFTIYYPMNKERLGRVRRENCFRKKQKKMKSFLLKINI